MLSGHVGPPGTISFLLIVVSLYADSCFTCTIHIYSLEYVPYALTLRPDTIYEIPFALTELVYKLYY